MKDTTKNNKAFEKNIYIKGYTQEDQDRLALLWDDFFAMKQEQQEHRIKAAKDDYGARRQKSKDVAAKGSKTHTPPQRLPRIPRSKWKMQTQVATNKPVLPGVVSIPTTGTE